MKHLLKIVSGVAVAAGLLVAAQSANATENGGDNIGQGSEGFFAGALPPPGWYGVTYGNRYRATRFNDGNGHSSIPSFDLKADVLAGRLFYMTDLQVAGGRLGFFAIGSFASPRSETSAGRMRRDGAGDITVGPTVGWEHGAWHTLVAVDVVVPTGSYDKQRALNTGNNYASFRPIYAFSYLPTNGMELSAKVSYTFNTINPATHYRSGQLFHVDYSLTFPVSDALRLGVNGYLIKQTTDDREHGARAGPDGSRGRVFAFGPAAQYRFGKASLDFKLVKEFAVRNRAEGSSLWAKLVVPF
nr:transporter [Luteibacter rhizovicinus]